MPAKGNAPVAAGGDQTSRPRLTRLVLAAGLLALCLPLAAALSTPAGRAVLIPPPLGEARATAVTRLRHDVPVWSALRGGVNQLLLRFGVIRDPGAAIRGEDGWLFLGENYSRSVTQNRHRLPVPETWLADTVEILRLQARYLARRGTFFVVLPAPAAGTIYPDKLPAWARPEDGRPSLLDRLAKAAPDIILDVRPALIAARTIAATYVPADSHWTPFGAAIAWRLVSERLRGSNVCPTIPEQGEILPAPARVSGDIARMVGIPDLIDTVTTRTGPPWSGVMGAPEGETLQPLPVPTAVRIEMLPYRSTATVPACALLLMRDSFGAALSPWAMGTFSPTLQTRSHAVDAGARPGDLVQLVATLRPRIVVIEVAERYLLAPFGDLSQWRAIEAQEGGGGSGADLTPPPTAPGRAGGGRLRRGRLRQFAVR